MPTIKELFEAGIHYGHTKDRSDARSRDFIYGVRDRVFLINLEKTLEKLKEALEVLKRAAKEEKTILWVGTKTQASDVVAKAAKECAMPFVAEKWQGGTLTNFETIQKSLKKIEELEKKIDSETFQTLTKRERGKTKELLGRLHRQFDGLRELKALPHLLFVADAGSEKIAVKEANRLRIPIVAITDTNANPGLIDYPIPANTKSFKAIELLVNQVKEAVLEGSAKRKGQSSKLQRKAQK